MRTSLVANVDLLACPHCGSAFVVERGVLRCSRGHDFDIAREGYVNLTSSRAAKLRSDTRAMVDSRVRLHATGWFGPVADAIANRARAPLAGGASIADLGCGPGTYLGPLVEVSGTVRAVGVDLSKDAIRCAARAVPGAAFAVGDVADDIPLAGDAFDVVLNAFAPRNPTQIARILRPDGLVIVVAAGSDHLHELVEGLGLLKVPEDKEEALIDRFESHFSIEEVGRIRYVTPMDTEQVRDAVLMGPNRWHMTDDQMRRIEDVDGIDVTSDVLILSAQPRT